MMGACMFLGSQGVQIVICWIYVAVRSAFFFALGTLTVLFHLI
jgi:hypothetical protein